MFLDIDVKTFGVDVENALSIDQQGIIGSVVMKALSLDAPGCATLDAVFEDDFSGICDVPAECFEGFVDPDTGLRLALPLESGSVLEFFKLAYKDRKLFFGQFFG